MQVKGPCSSQGHQSDLWKWRDLAHHSDLWKWSHLAHLRHITQIYAIEGTLLITQIYASEGTLLISGTSLRFMEVKGHFSSQGHHLDLWKWRDPFHHSDLWKWKDLAHLRDFTQVYESEGTLLISGTSLTLCIWSQCSCLPLNIHSGLMSTFIIGLYSLNDKAPIFWQPHKNVARHR